MQVKLTISAKNFADRYKHLPLKKGGTSRIYLEGGKKMHN
jgi:hypothetical protein